MSVTPPDLQALLEASGRGDAAAVAAALEAAPHLVNQRGELGESGLRTALHFGVAHLEVVRELLRRGADPNLRDQGDDAQPLHFAAERGQMDVIRLLIEHGADPVGAGTVHGLDALGWATVFGGAAPAVVAYLLEHGAQHSLPSAVATGNVEAIRALAVAGGDLNQEIDRANRRRHLLHLAVVKRQTEAARVLVELGVELEATDAAGLTALDQAAVDQEAEIAAMLEAAGAHVGLPAALGLGREASLRAQLHDEPSAFGFGGRWARLAHRVAEHGSAAMIERLAQAGASLWVADEAEAAVDGTKNYTPLHAAAWNGNTEAARALLGAGVPASPRDSKYCGTPAGWADYAGNVETRNAILEGECDIWDAIAYDRQERVAAILARDPAARGRAFGDYAACGPKPTETPLERAQALGRREIAALLAAPAGELNEVAADFLGFACWDNDTHGAAGHRMHDRAAQRLLALHPGIAQHSLYTAVVCGEVDEVQRRLAADPRLATLPGGPRQWPPLLYACFARFTHPETHRNSATVARLLLDSGANPNSYFPAGGVPYSALVGAAGGGEQESPRQPQSVALYRLLLDHGAGPYDRQVLYNTHFHGDVRWWLELSYERATALGRQADWDDPAWPMFDMAPYGTGAAFLFRTAVRQHDPELARWLLAHGARPQDRPRRQDQQPESSLYNLALASGQADLAALLAAHGAGTTPPPAVVPVERASDPRATQALHQAARQNRTAEVARLLHLGVPVDAPGRHQEQALHGAAIGGGLETVDLLLARGADPNAVENRYYATPFGWACHGEQWEVVQRLLPLTADVWAMAFHAFVDRLREVLQARPELARQVRPEGYTTLWWLPDDEHAAAEVVELLLAAGADAGHRLPSGRSAADWARKRGMVAIARLLEEAAAGASGAQPQACNPAIFAPFQ